MQDEGEQDEGQKEADAASVAQAVSSGGWLVCDRTVLSVLLACTEPYCKSVYPLSLKWKVVHETLWHGNMYSMWQQSSQVFKSNNNYDSIVDRDSMTIKTTKKQSIAVESCLVATRQ